MIFPKILILSIFIVGGLNLYIFSSNKNLKTNQNISLFISFFTFLNLINLLLYHLKVSQINVTIISLSSDINMEFRTNIMGLVFSIMACFLWFCTQIYSFGIIEKEKINRLNFWITAAVLCVFAISLSENLFTIFVFYEILTFVTYPLINFNQNQDSEKISRKYLFILLGCSFLFFLPAIVITSNYYNNLQFSSNIAIMRNDYLIFILITLYIFGIAKIAIMPLHSWLVKSMIAPFPVSALLHAVAVVNSGIFIFLKIVTFKIGLNNICYIASVFVFLIGAFSAIISGLIAKKQTNLKIMLAYSTISQLSICVMVTSMVNLNAINACFLHMIAHSLSKITLFFVAGYFYNYFNTTQIIDIKSTFYKMKLPTICFTICSLSIIGVPPLACFYSKFYMFFATKNQGFIELANLIVIIISTLITASYLLPFIYQLYEGSKIEDKPHLVNNLPVSLVTLIVITFGVFIPNFLNMDIWKLFLQN